MAHKQEKRAAGSIGDRLRRFIAYNGMTIRELSYRSGIPYRTLQDHITDLRSPGVQHLLKLAAIGIDVHWLVTGKVRPPLKCDYPGEDWPELAEQIGAFPPTLLTDLYDLAFVSTDAFAVRYQQRHGTPLTVQEAFSAAAVYHLLILRSAARLLPLIAAATKSPPKSADLRSMLSATVTPDLDSMVEERLRRLL